MARIEGRRLRLTVALLSACLIAISINALVEIEHEFGREKDYSKIAILAVLSELLIGFVGGTALSFIWALFNPAWAERALASAGRHVWLILLIMLVVMMGVLVIVSISKAR